MRGSKKNEKRQMLTAWTIARARLAGSPDYENPLSPLCQR